MSRTSLNCAETDGETCTSKNKDVLLTSSIRECAEICNGITSGFTFGDNLELESGYCDDDGCICNCEQINECYDANQTSVPLYHFPIPDRGTITFSQIHQ